MTQKRPLRILFPRARWVPLNPKNAWVDSTAPANGIAGTSAPLCVYDAYRRSDGKLVDGAHSRSNSNVAILSDPQHRLLGRFIHHQLGQDAGFLRSLAPIFGVFEIRRSGHGTRPLSGRIGASVALRLGAYSRFDGKLVLLIRDLEHRLLDPYVAHLLGQGAGFFRSPVPISVVVELRCKEHGTRPFSDPHTLTQETPCGSCSNKKCGRRCTKMPRSGLPAGFFPRRGFTFAGANRLEASGQGPWNA